MTNAPRKFRVWVDEPGKMLYPPRHDYVLSGAGGLFYYKDLDAPSTYTVMFYTGLDDAEGNEIYEGDIVRYYQDQRAIVDWHPSHAGFTLNGVHPHDVPSILDRCKVVGNRYETPELLEEVAP